MLVELQTRDRQEWLPTFTPSAEILKEATPAGIKKEGYYGLPMLKRPTWRWQIAGYFFLEGVSAGSFLMASLAGRAGGKRFRPGTRAGHVTGRLAVLPCPPLPAAADRRSGRPVAVPSHAARIQPFVADESGLGGAERIQPAAAAARGKGFCRRAVEEIPAGQTNRAADPCAFAGVVGAAVV